MKHTNQTKHTRNSNPVHPQLRLPPLPRTQQGFTLLEILVATAILGTTVAALFSLLSASLGNVQRLRGPSKALLLGQSRMNEILTVAATTAGTPPPMPLDQKIEGRWDDQYRWEALATPVNVNSGDTPGPVVLVHVSLDVFWRADPGKQEKKFSLETVQLWPRQPEGVQ
ncbi:MAG: prepilin-type N-terminal cleavage/methylation domain-containing protein [Acidobacteria bacterium]|nr:prepilin-type N-terminal cleavage/methylation domain-containing protein [Acidobacteriota bacterium]